MNITQQVHDIGIDRTLFLELVPHDCWLFMYIIIVSGYSNVLYLLSINVNL